jgi:hypothetical protein
VLPDYVIVEGKELLSDLVAELECPLVPKWMEKGKSKENRENVSNKVAEALTKLDECVTVGRVMIDPHNTSCFLGAEGGSAGSKSGPSLI